MLTFAEEILLLLLDDETEDLIPLPRGVLNVTLSGAVLMDLAIRMRIDTDLETLTVVDPTPVGEELLDFVLEEVVAADAGHSTDYWVERVSQFGEAIKEKAFARLVERGILKIIDDKILWVLEIRRYPVIDDREEREVKRRILDVILSDDIPDPRDIVLICLADACSIFDEILTARELESASDRIVQVRKLDLIGQAVARTIERFRMNLTKALSSMHV